MVKDFCHLCNQYSDLVEGHIWAKFAYKDYVSDLSKGGSFVDLAKGKVHNRQYWRSWFCARCDNEVLGQLDGYAAQLCRRLRADPTKPQTYDEHLSRFAASLCWRVAKLDVEHRNLSWTIDLRAACRRWKEHVRGERDLIRPYSLHLFVLFGIDIQWEKFLGGETLLKDGLILSQIGPLFIVGLLNRRQFNLSELKVWEATEIAPADGTVTPIDKWTKENITKSCYKLLRKHEKSMIGRALALGQKRDVH